jgi:hypothetical protein
MRWAYKRRFGAWLQRQRRMDGYSLMELVIVITLATVAMPGIVSMFTTVLNKSHDAEFMFMAEMLAVEQMETVLAKKAAYGYSGIDSLVATIPTGSFASFGRTLVITVVNAGDRWEYKRIDVTVTQPLIPLVKLTTAVYNQTNLPPFP